MVSADNERVTTYVALLRGINLGSTNKISMPRLRAMAEELGYADVRTHINSGNLILGSSESADAVTSQLSAAITATFGLRIDVTVRTAAELAATLAANPYPDGDPSQVTIAFLTGPVGADAPERVSALAAEGEEYVFGEREIYVHYAHGIGKSKLALRFSAVIGVSATVRNVRTVGKILALCTPSA